jgi:hypothetical protein
MTTALQIAGPCLLIAPMFILAAADHFFPPAKELPAEEEA